MARPSLIAACLAAALAAAAPAPADAPAPTVSTPGDSIAGPAAEHYRYRSSPLDADSAEVEHHTVEITTSSTDILYSFHTTRDDDVERGVIRTGSDGTLRFAVRRASYDASGVIADFDSIAIDGDALLLVQRRVSKTSVKRESRPAGRPVAVDASLLLWMRRFPFGSDEPQEVFMADWSQRTVNVDVHDRGLETVTVPAGTFECRRMEVVVKVFVFRPKITFWISAEPPHFMVRHKGKRGPFTPVYHTVLVGKGQP